MLEDDHVFSEVRKLGDKLVILGGTVDTSQVIAVSGQGGGGDATVSGYLAADAALSGSLTSAYLASDVLLSGVVTSGYQAADTALSGALSSAFEAFITAEIAAVSPSSYDKVFTEIETVPSLPADLILTTSGSGDLAAAVSGLLEGQVLEIRSNAVFSPITLPSGVACTIKVGQGFFPTISGQECIRLMNGSANIVLDGLYIENCTTSYANGRGSAITFGENHAIASGIIFNNITIRNAQGSAILLAYYNGSDYATCPTLEQMSKNISFVGCHIHKGTTDIVEGASLRLTGSNGALISNCYIDAVNLGRGINIQDSVNVIVEKCFVANCNDGNGGEGIKLDLLGSVPAYRNSAIVRDNTIKRCIEGIDIDDHTSCNIIQNNVVSECVGVGISVDGGTPNGLASIVGNTCYKNAAGIRLESGSVAVLKKNVCYSNGTNYLIQNGYTVDDSNTTALDDSFIAGFGSIVKNDSTVSGTTVSAALTVLGTYKQGIESGLVRPSGALVGQSFFDTALSPAVPIWWTGSSWVNASGVAV